MVMKISPSLYACVCKEKGLIVFSKRLWCWGRAARGHGLPSLSRGRLGGEAGINTSFSRSLLCWPCRGDLLHGQEGSSVSSGCWRCVVRAVAGAELLVRSHQDSCHRLSSHPQSHRRSVVFQSLKRGGDAWLPSSGTGRSSIPGGSRPHLGAGNVPRPLQRRRRCCPCSREARGPLPGAGPL